MSTCPLEKVILTSSSTKPFGDKGAVYRGRHPGRCNMDEYAGIRCFLFLIMNRAWTVRTAKTGWLINTSSDIPDRFVLTSDRKQNKESMREKIRYMRLFRYLLELQHPDEDSSEYEALPLPCYFHMCS